MALQKDRDIRRITIVGGGTTGYLAAFYFSINYPNKEITWIYPKDNNPIGVGESLIPRSSQFINKFNRTGKAGLGHLDIIKHCNGTAKLGIIFDGFNRPGEKFDFPFGFGERTSFNTASIKRIMYTEKIPENILDYPDISTHFRTTELLEYLGRLSNDIPNLIIKRQEVTLEELSGTYDLLIDSTGFNSKLSFIPANFEDISHIIPNNCALVYRHEYTNKKEQCKPYSIFKAMDYGWIWNIPLGDQIAMGYVHCDKYDVKDQFIEYVENKLGIKIDPNKIGKVKFTTGRNKIHLKDNIVRIGLASGFVEPLESTGIYLITSSIEKITQYIEGSLSEYEYNNAVNQAFDDIVNFIVAHYKYSKRDNEYWNHYKNIPVEKYKETEIFPKEAWDYILSGFDETLPAPTEPIDPAELIKIHRGMPYQIWLENAKNSS